VVFVITKLRINRQTQRTAGNVAVTRSTPRRIHRRCFRGYGRGKQGGLKTAHPVGFLGRAFFLQLLRCVTIKATILCNHFSAPFSSIFNHLRYSLNTSHKAFRHVTTAREMRRPACEVPSSFDALRLPSPVPEECHSRSTNRTVHITLGVPNSKH
jgi:hypothetical protein